MAFISYWRKACPISTSVKNVFDFLSPRHVQAEFLVRLSFRIGERACPIPGTNFSIAAVQNIFAPQCLGRFSCGALISYRVLQKGCVLY